MTAGWRECADPVELAAAVAAGVEVLCVAVDGRTWETGCEDSESFRRCMANGCRYRVPASWSWSPEPPADVPTGAERYLAERLADPEYRAAYEPPAPVTGDDLRDAVHLLDLAWGVIANADGWNDDTSWRQAAERWRDGYHRLLDDIRTTAPVPPWPGAVLSGLCDEDGEPTWLAQAGQVRGEQVRRRSDFMWVNNDQMVAHLDTVWVEVRAPRAVPEPETERVPWYRAMGRELVDGLLCVENAMIREVGREGDRVYVCGYEDPDNPDEDDRGDWQWNYWYGRDGFDGTVEVLARDGDQ